MPVSLFFCFQTYNLVLFQQTWRFLQILWPFVHRQNKSWAFAKLLPEWKFSDVLTCRHFRLCALSVVYMGLFSAAAEVVDRLLLFSKPSSLFGWAQVKVWGDSFRRMLREGRLWVLCALTLKYSSAEGRNLLLWHVVRNACCKMWRKSKLKRVDLTIWTGLSLFPSLQRVHIKCSNM